MKLPTFTEEMLECYVNNVSRDMTTLESQLAQTILNERAAKTQLSGDTERLLQINELRSSIHAAHGLLAPLGSQVTPSVMAIREALSILRRHA